MLRLGLFVCMAIINTPTATCCGLNSTPQPLTCRHVIASYSTTACARFVALTPKPSFASVSTRNDVGVGSVILPTYNPLGGPNGKGAVNFNRINSQYVNAGSRSLNINTNGGLTIVAVLRFTGAGYDGERIIDFGSAPSPSTRTNPYNNIFIGRSYPNKLQITVMNANSFCFESVPTIVSGENWLSMVFRYSAITKVYESTSEGQVLSSGVSSIAVLDRTVSDSWIGKSWYGANPYFNGDIAGLFVVDEYLSTAATTAIVDAMKQGPGALCLECNTVDCTCNPGYTGPNGGVCLPCAAGTNTSVANCDNVTYTCAAGYSGSACIACEAGSWSAAGASACTACTDGASSPAGSTAAAACLCWPGQGFLP
jgi:hypothetical protein